MKLIELPKACPECGRVFGPDNRPKYRMQYKAKLTLFAAVLATCVWIVLLIALVAWLEVIVMPESPAAAATMFAIAIAPGTILGGWAVKMPRIARRMCPKCSWSRDYTIDGVR